MRPPKWLHWASDSWGFRLAADSKILRDLVMGASQWNSERWRPVLRRILHHLEIGCGHGWRVADAEGPVLWKRRAHNYMSDYLCGQTMARRASWHHGFCPSAAGMPRNLLLFSDGGVCRGRGASAWMLVCDTRQENVVLEAAGGVYYDHANVPTPFAAEL